jgi:long-chain acyl-CoA synthetase
MSADTLPGLLVERAAAAPNAVALRFFRQGKWNDVTLAQLQDKAASIGGGLSARGVKSGEVVAVIAEDGPLSMAAELGAQGIGAIVLTLDPALLASEVVAKIQASKAAAVIVGDQEQFDKVEESRSEVPNVRLLVVDATRGLRELERLDRTDKDRTMTVAQLAAETTAASWVAGVSSISAGAAARTNGTINATHESLLTQARALATRLSLSKADALCSLQPLANSTEHALAVAGPLLNGSVLHFRGRATPQQAMRQVQPTVVYANPHWLARVSADTDAQVARATGLKKFALAKGLKRKPAESVLSSGRRPNMLRVGGLITAALVAIMFAISSNGNDVVRVLVAIAIAVAAGFILLSAGHGVAGPIRRRYGLSRCRAVLSSDGTSLPGADLLGGLQIPLIDAMQEATS